MLIVWAANSSTTSAVTSGRHSRSPMLLASPQPVTRPKCALTSYTALISG